MLNWAIAMSDRSRSLDELEEIARADARVVPGDDDEWSVYEFCHPTDLCTSLIFDSVKIVRRVRTFPPNWRDLSDGELFELSRSF